MALKKLKANNTTEAELVKRAQEDQRIYDQIVSELKDSIDIKRDTISLSILAQAINTINLCNKELEDGGLTFVAGNDYRQVRPEVAIKNKAIATVIKLSSLFGLSPKDRILMNKDAAKMNVVDEAGDDL
jgi:phage terminase small subunit